MTVKLTNDYITTSNIIDIREYKCLSDAVTAIGSKQVTLVISELFDVDENVTVPSNITLKFTQGGRFDIGSGYTVTINGHIEAGLYQVFSGDGSINFGFNATVYPEWWGAVGDGTTDDSSALRKALDIGSKVLLTKSVYLCSNQVYSGVPLPEGIIVEGAKGGGLDSADGVVIKWTGTGILFDFQEPNGTAVVGNQTWKNIVFQSTNSGGGIFQFNDVSLSMTDDNTSPNYIREVRFNNCAFWGPGASTASANAIQGLGLIELVIDENCYFRDWKRAIYLKGCDNCTINGRFVLNTRHIHAESSNTFGNALKIEARFLGTPTSGLEDSCQLWLEVPATVIAPFIEGPADKGVVYLNARDIVIIDPYISVSSGSVFYLGEHARNCLIISPYYDGPSGPTMTYDGPATMEWGGTNEAYMLWIVNPSTRFMENIYQPHPRVRVINPNRWLNAEYNTRKQLTSNGVAIEKLVITAFDNDKLVVQGYGFSGLSGFVPDSNAHFGYCLSVPTGNGGAVCVLVVGKHINNGDTINVKYRYKLASSPGSGTFRWIIQRNGSNISNGDMGSSTSWAIKDGISYTLSGFSVGDVLTIGFYNVSDVVAYIDCMEISVD